MARLTTNKWDEEMAHLTTEGEEMARSHRTRRT